MLGKFLKYWRRRRARSVVQDVESGSPATGIRSESLEPRVLFSADLPWVEANVSDPDSFEQSYEQSVAPIVNAGLPAAQGVQADRQNLVVIDSSLLAQQQISGSLFQEQYESAGFGVALLDSDQDGLSQLSAVLSSHTGVAGVDILTTAEVDGINLGAELTSINDVLNNNALISGWGSQLDSESTFNFQVVGLDQFVGAEHMADLLTRLTGANVEFTAFDGIATGIGAVAQPEQQARHEIVFVDTGVEGYQALVDDIQAAAGTDRILEVVLLDQQRDGVDQISEILRGYNNLDAIHIVAHGTDGVVQLGASALSNSTLDAYDDALVGWQSALSVEADLLIYGCDLAASEIGEDLIRRVAELTGADVAASDDLTGAIGLGGDWNLEFADGEIEAQLAFSESLQANWDHVLATTPESLVNETTAGNQETNYYGGGSIASDANGNYVVVWQDNSSGTYDVYARLYNADGTPSSNEFLINSTTADDQRSAAVAMDADGDFVVTWASFDQDQSGTYGVYAQRFDSSGVSQGSEFQVNTIVTNDQMRSKVAMDDAGNFAITFTGKSSDLGDIYLQRYSADGNALGANVLINTTVLDSQGESNIAVDGATGNIVVVWESVNQDGDQSGIFARVLDASGTAVTGEMQVNVTTVGSQLNPKVDFSDDGGFVVVWDTGTADVDMAMRVFDSAGVAITSEIVVNTTTTGFQETGDVAVSTDGRFVVTWADDSSGSSSNIMAQLFNSDGSKFGSEVLINESVSGYRNDVSVTMTDGTASFSWSGAGVGDTAGVFTRSVQFFESDSAPTNLSSGIELNTDGGNDAYLISNSGLATSLDATTFEIQFSAQSTPAETVFMSFHNAAGDEYSIQLEELNGWLELDLGTDFPQYSTAIDYESVLVDGQVHSLAVTWDSTNGDWAVYIDGEFIDSGSALNTGSALDTTNGQFVFGQEQDGLDSSYASNQNFVGTIYDVRIWDEVRSEAEIALNHQAKFDVGSLPNGLVANWQMDGFDGSNEVVDIVSGNNLSIGSVLDNLSLLMIGWSNQVGGVTASGSTLTFVDDGAPVGWNSGITSGSFGLADDYRVSFDVPQLEASTSPTGMQAYTIGLSTTESDSTQGDVEYAMYFDSNILGGGAVRVQVLGVETDYALNYSEGDTFAFHVDGTDVHFQHNGVTFHTESDLTGAEDWYVDTSWYANGSGAYSDQADYSVSNFRLNGSSDFVVSTPLEDLHINENSLNGSSVGFVVPTDPDTPNDVLADGRFLEVSPTPTMETYYATGQSFGGWTVTNGSVDLLPSSFLTDLNGGLSVDLSGGEAGTIESDSFDTVIGQTYQVTFALNGNFTGGDVNSKGVRASAAGASEDFVVDHVGVDWANEHWEYRTFTFTADSNSTSLSFESLDASAFGAYLTNVSVVEVPAAVSSILNNDPSLSYDAATDKFYRFVDAGVYFNTALAAANSDLVNGVAGQLVTIRSAYENTLVQQFAIESGQEIWLGAQDANADGNWNWLEGDAESGEQFWTGGSGGSSTTGSFAPTFGQSGALGEDNARLTATGAWADQDAASFHAYMVEWDASEVLSSFTFSLTDDAGGRFSIDSSSGEITVANGSLLDYETAIAHDIDVQVTDAAGNSYIETMSVGIDNGIEVTDSVPGAQTVAEDAQLIFSSGNGNAITVTDTVASSSTLLQVSLSVDDGDLTLSQLSGLTIVAGANGSGSITFNGSESAINAALEGMTFDPDDNFTGSVSLAITTSTAAGLEGLYTFGDGTADDSSVGTSYDGTLFGNALTVNDPTRGDVLSLDGAGDYVEITGLLGEPENITLAAWINSSSTDSFGAVIISAGESPALYLEADGRLTGYYESGGTDYVITTQESFLATGWRHVAVSIDTESQELTLYVDGVASETIATSGPIEYDHSPNTHIGRSGNGLSGFDFGGMIDDAQIYSRALSGSEVASLASGNTFDSDTVAITVTPINDAAVITGLDGDALNYDEGDGAVVIDQGTAALVADLDSPDFDGGNLTVTSAAASGGTQDQLSIRNQGIGAGEIGFDGSNVTYANVLIGTASGGSNGSDLVITLNSNANEVAVSALAQNVTYENSSTANPSESDRTIAFSVNDGDGATSLSHEVTISVNRVNDAPVNGLQATQTVFEDGTLVFSTGNSNAISVNDVDSSSSDIRVTLTVTNGTFTLAGTAGLSSVSGNGTTTVTIEGPNTAIYAALNGSSYSPTANYAGAATLTMTSNDLGNSGSGGALTDTDVMNITVTAVNDAPELDLDADNSAAAGADFVASWTEGAGAVAIVDADAVISDIDSPNLSSLTVTLTNVLDGAAELLSADTTGTLIAATYDAGTGVLTLNGSDSVANYQQVLRSVTYNNTSQGADTTIRVINFQANDGVNLSSVVQTSVSMAVSNDVPTIVNNTLTISEGGSVTLSAAELSAQDPDNLAGGLNFSVFSIVGGQFETLANPGVAITSFSQQQVTDSEIRFVHDGGEGAPSYNVRVDDGVLSTIGAAATINFTNVNAAPSGVVTINNLAPSQGDTLTASNTLADADGLSGSISYQWYLDGVAISGATGTTYTTVQADVGGAITAVASYTDDAGTDESVTSAATAAVANVNDAVVGQPIILGTTTEDQALTVDTSGISDADGLGSFSYQWYRDGVAIGPATGSSHVLSDADVGANLTVEVSFTDGQGSLEATLSAAVGPIANVNDAPTGSVTVDNMSPSEGDTLIANNTLSDADGLSGSISYQWYRDGVAISGATGTAYSTGQADVGTAITVVSSYTDDQGTAESVSSAATAAVVNVNDLVSGQPAILGVQTEDQTLTADTTGISDEDGLSVFSFQWYRDGVAVSGATASSYLLGDVDVDAVLTVAVSYVDGYGAAESTSSGATGAIANVNDTPTGAVAIDNLSPTQGGTLTVSNTLVDADGLSGSISYQWYRDGMAISGATGITYATTQADVGGVITALASYTDDQGTSENALSAATAAVANVNDAVSGQPVVLGTTTEDQTLTIDTSAISDTDGLGAFSYQWYRDGVAVTGASANSYVLGDADVGANISVAVSYVDGYGAAESTTSNAVGLVANLNDAPTGAVSIDNLSPVQGETLTASNTLADADGLSGAVSYQWYRDGVVIAGASTGTYTTVQADVGGLITAVASYTDDQGTAETVTSTATAAVTNVNDGVLGQPVILGVATEDQTLTVDTLGISDADGLGALSYQWYRDGVAIAGETGTSLLLGNADVGANIAIEVSYTDGQGAPENTTSLAVGPVANLNDTPTGSVTIDNLSPVQGDPLTAANSLADADGLSGTVSYQWYRDGVAISGATGSTHVTGQADVGSTITVLASYTDDQGTAESVLSNATAAVTNVNDVVAGQPVILGTPTEDQILTIDTSGISDADGLGPFSYQWFRDGIAISGATADSLALSDIDVGTNISVAASFTDGYGAVESSTSVWVGPIANANDVPVVTPGLVLSVTENSLVGTVVGQVSATDLDAMSVLGNWTIVSGNGGGAFSIDSVTGEIRVADASALDFELTPTFWLGVTVSDGLATSAVVDVRVDLTDLNEAPVLVDDQLVTSEDTAFIIDSAQLLSNDSDPEASPLALVSITQPMNGIVIDQLDGTWHYQPNADFHGVERISYRVTDGVNQVTAELEVFVTSVNDAPEVLTPNLITLQEDVSGVADIAVLDIDGDLMTFTLTGGSDANAFEVDRNSGALRFTDAPDFEQPTDADQDNVYELLVTVDDGNGGQTVHALQVDVANTNETPMLEPASMTVVADEAGLRLGQLNAVDPDTGDTLTFEITGGDPDQLFQVDAANGELYRTDADTPVGLYQLNVRVTDAAGLSSLGVIEVAVTKSVESEVPVEDDTLTTTDSEEPRSDNPSTAELPKNDKPLPLEPTEKAERSGEAPNLRGGLDAPQVSLDQLPFAQSSNNVPNFTPVALPVVDAAEATRPSTQPGQHVGLNLRLILAESEGGTFAAVGTLVDQFANLSLPVSAGLADALDALAEAALSQDTEVDLRVSGAVVGSMSLSAGFVVWMLRGGSLMASLLSSKPMWTEFDPLPVFAEDTEEEDADDPFQK